MENFGTALVGGLSGLQGMLSGSTGAAAVGNVNMGNVAIDQLQLAPNRTSAFMSSWQNDISGNTFSSNALTGRTAVSLLRNQGYASRVVSMRVSEQDVQDASRQVDAARSEAVTASNDRSAALTEAFTRGLTKLRSSRESTGSTSSSFEQWGETLNRLDQITQSVANTTGLSQAQVARIALGASGHLGLSIVGAGIQGNASADKSYTSGLSAAEQRALASLSSEQLAEFKQFGDRISRDRSFATLVASSASEGRNIASRLSAATSRTERADSSLAERTAFAERVATAYERGETLSIDIAQDPYNLDMFTRYAERYGGTSESFSDASAVPASFRDLLPLHEHAVTAPRLAPGIAGQHDLNGERVRQFQQGVQDSLPPPSRDESDLRTEVQDRAARIRSKVAAEGQTFDKDAQVTQSSDGTLASKRSLLKQAGKQVKEDASGMVDDARQALKDAYLKK
jgi:conjugal transfer mating pair stabilization protein TraG